MPQIIIEVTEEQLAVVKETSEELLSFDQLKVLDPLKWFQALIEREIDLTRMFVTLMFDQGSNSLGDVFDEIDIDKMKHDGVIAASEEG